MRGDQRQWWVGGGGWWVRPVEVGGLETRSVVPRYCRNQMGFWLLRGKAPPPPVCLLEESLSPFLKDVPAHVTEETAAPEAPGVYH